MPLMDELKAEIARLARKEIKKEIDALKKASGTQRGLIANLRREVSDLRRDVSRLSKGAGRPAPVDDQKSRRFWISGKGIVSLRKRLGLTQNEFALLVDASPQTIVKWEATQGTISFRSEETAKHVQSVRSLGKRAAKEKLAQLSHS